jgi:hypothetical protein
VGICVDDLVRFFGAFLARDLRDCPVLVLTGSPQCGKSTALEDLTAELVRAEVPHAAIDCAALTAQTPELLTTLMFELNRKGAYGRLAFPRLLTGLMIMPLKLDELDPAQARHQVQQELERYRKVDQLRQFLVDLAVKAIRLIPAAQDHPEMEDAANWAALLLKALLTPRILRITIGRKVLLGPGQEWYRHQDRGLNRDPLDALVDLSRRAARVRKGSNRQWLAEVLWLAFLADLHASFEGHDDWDRNCAVLLDSADTPAGRRFLDELSQARNLRREKQHTDAPLTVIAASRGPLADRVLPLGGEAVPLFDASVADYERRTGAGQVERGWYPVLLPDLTQVETRNLVAAVGPVTDELASTVVYEFTEGHPGATHAIVAQLRRSPDPADLAAVLWPAGPAGNGTPRPALPATGEALVRSLTRGLSEGAVRDLVKCAAARDLPAANRLDTSSGLLTGPRGARDDIFARELWARRPADGHGGTSVMIMLPVLRRLLARRLAAAPADWFAVHDYLRCRSAGEGDLDGELYYTLALGEVQDVATRLAKLLAERMTEQGAIDWLRRWHSVTAAPRARADNSAAAIVELVRWARPGDQPAAAVGALVAARWLLANSLRAGDRRDLHAEIAASLDVMAPFTGAGRMVVRAEAEKYRRLAED